MYNNIFVTNFREREKETKTRTSFINRYLTIHNFTFITKLGFYLSKTTEWTDFNSKCNFGQQF